MKENGAFPSGFYKETDGIFRLQIPFDGLYTSVFLIKTASGAFLVDCGTTQADVEEILLPALEEIGYKSFLTIEREVGDDPERDIRKAVP